MACLQTCSERYNELKLLIPGLFVFISFASEGLLNDLQFAVLENIIETRILSPAALKTY